MAKRKNDIDLTDVTETISTPKRGWSYKRPRFRLRLPATHRSRLILGGAIVAAMFMAWIVTTLIVYSKDLPSIERVYNIKPRLVTRLYDRNNDPFYDFYTERRVWTPFEKIPKNLIQALIASEDRGFYEHWGVEWTAIVRGVIIQPLRGQRPQGGSTITQQLARQLFLTRDRTIARKVKEWMTAVRLERRYAKDEIIEMYLNQNYYGAGAYGVQAAAQTYFGKNIEDLKVEESAVLVGLLPAPSRYSPRANEELSRQRRNVVLRAMVAVGYLDEEMYDSLAAQPIVLNSGQSERHVGDYFAEEVRRYIGTKYGEDTLYTEGLQIYTTIDTALQRYAEQIVRDHLDSLRAAAEARHSPNDPVYTIPVYDTALGETVRVHKKLQAALIAIDNATGGVLAMVGGYDFGESEFNRATQALRQPGSAFKPFVLTTAIEEGFLPRDTIYDSPIVLNIPGFGEWSPNNFDQKFKGPISIRQGIQESRNLVSIKLLLNLDPHQVAFYAKRMGITTPLAPVPSLAIGSSEVIPIDLAGAYSVFPNGGIRTQPTLIKKVTDRFGGIIEDNSTPVREEVLSAQNAYVVLHVLKSVMQGKGTGAGARRRGFTRPAAGKTGTSNEYMDNWFAGFTPQITTVVWVGYDLKTPIGGYHTGTGAATALPIWTEFMKVACDSLPPIDFAQPSGVYLYTACNDSYLRATNACPGTHEEVTLKESDTLDVCPIHGGDRKAKRRRL
ncbi:MAG: PBP1A family penicillin-binding protein [Candidatus Zixiibacteriota bacterium]